MCRFTNTSADLLCTSPLPCTIPLQKASQHLNSLKSMDTKGQINSTSTRVNYRKEIGFTFIWSLTGGKPITRFEGSYYRHWLVALLSRWENVNHSNTTSRFPLGVLNGHNHRRLWGGAAFSRTWGPVCTWGATIPLLTPACRQQWWHWTAHFKGNMGYSH